MIRLALLALIFAASRLCAAGQMLIVVGAAGEPSYQTDFAIQATAWQKAAADAGMASQTVGLASLPSGSSDLAFLRQALADTPKTGGDLWIVLLGHGTSDGRDTKFNLRGDDLQSAEFSSLLKPFQRRLILLNFFAASGGFVPHLAGENHIVITSTRSNGERNFSRLGKYVAEALAAPASDIDGSGDTSLREFLIYGTKQLRDFYATEKRIVTEHAVIDDNGDGKGTQIDELMDLAKTPKDGNVTAEIFLSPSSGGLLGAEARARRDDLEAQIAKLRQQKDTLSGDDYYKRLEKLLLQLAALYEQSRPPAAS